MFNSFFGQGGGGGHQQHFHFGGGGRRGGHHGGFNDGFEEEHIENLFENSDVVSLDLQSISQFYRRREIWVLFFHKSNEEDSRKLKDEYKVLAEKMFGIIKIGAIDCLAEEELCEEFGVYDSPTIKIYTETADDDGVKFTGKKEWKSISSAASQKM
jgi:hypothetical protein